MSEELDQWRGPARTPSAEELADRYAASQLVKIYALGVDMRNYELSRSAFTDDAFADGSAGKAPIDEYLPKIFTGVAAYEATQHNITNQHVRIQGDEALVWSYAIAVHKVRAGDSRPDMTLGVQYRDTCRRTADGWRIAHRKVDRMWTELFAPRKDAQ
jgi:hypothetical protein